MSNLYTISAIFVLVIGLTASTEADQKKEPNIGVSYVLSIESYSFIEKKDEGDVLFLKKLRKLSKEIAKKSLEEADRNNLELVKLKKFKEILNFVRNGNHTKKNYDDFFKEIVMNLHGAVSASPSGFQRCTYIFQMEDNIYYLTAKFKKKSGELLVMELWRKAV